MQPTTDNPAALLAEFDAALTAAQSELDPLRRAGGDLPTQLARSAKLMRWLHDGGWIRIGWPESVGGVGGPSSLRCLILERLARRGYPIPHHLYVLEVVGPAVVNHAPELAAQLLPAALRGDELWCQGFSEPEAGSDLAALRTRAHRRDDGSFVINGQKTWTSYGARADRMVLLARTGTLEERHRGLTMLLVDLDAPGVERRPIELASGQEELAEEFFSDVVVDGSRVVGEVGGGWAVAMDLLQYERGSYAWMRMAVATARLADLLGELRDGDTPVGAEAVIGRTYLRLAALRARTSSTLQALAAGQVVGPQTSVDKLLLSAAEQEVYDAAARLRATEFLVGDADRWREEWWYSRAASIYGGAREIQHSIIADRILNLPREDARGR
ncbi:acyl-CoA dehydrogenase, C-terminal domain protein [Mycolicibacterium hassiacum DSM 44199]|jgi:alkylation response protein AidB-like acyl-CoA dehydrogenase|uniref:Acyl-CoA dehydrogenase, C-terminal domain protein n=1 Tax=Mycolicibacterium hassiacum (strain DSM 44199 / CIP 105218 / JCM 12690 / 3849) TaxID=1122247 RepID=K5BD08_MYCHD|nr:acyl-CoA dehydrogenase family protein [Mycolicibacterium hassiacum]EKF21186.1 acyl-CoA dehydrogenase, C-terminal domain protein [Mycolicibacterium hassiacum DSM 44199]MBX5487227.1 acyl-CoA dehydrogenase family protein [Mycolicibacterium hassiacum]MDA4086409.1 acyl-CoA dehydrogenase [Mycolicibacterium hassiacum DSM 44199]VCT91384.1 Putative acyl-CoA dehydrogenase FadE17 [Mycolicibacterium hassiacum DSM 44199]